MNFEINFMLMAFKGSKYEKKNRYTCTLVPPELVNT